MAININIYTDPSTYVQEVIVPSALALANVPLVSAIVGPTAELEVKTADTNPLTRRMPAFASSRG